MSSSSSSRRRSSRSGCGSCTDTAKSKTRSLLRARNIYHELIVFPDDVHETLLHSRWLYTFDRMETFLHKFLPPNGN